MCNSQWTHLIDGLSEVIFRLSANHFTLQVPKTWVATWINHDKTCIVYINRYVQYPMKLLENGFGEVIFRQKAKHFSGPLYTLPVFECTQYNFGEGLRSFLWLAPQTWGASLARQITKRVFWQAPSLECSHHLITIVEVFGTEKIWKQLL